MTKRDMIIIAILVNTGLLAVLFMMAINSDSDTVTDPITIQQPIAEVTLNVPSQTVSEPTFTPPAQSDESDVSLKEFSTDPAPLPVLQEESASTHFDEEESLAEEAPKQVKPKLEAEQPKESEKKVVEVTVKRGDSLDKIARANGTTIKEIKDTNKLTSTRLDIGQVLKVPVGSKKSAPAQATSKPASKPAKKDENKQVASSDIQYYTIKAGDNPWKIARQFHLKVDDLLKLNNMDEDKARNLKAGDKIRIK